MLFVCEHSWAVDLDMKKKQQDADLTLSIAQTLHSTVSETEISFLLLNNYRKMVKTLNQFTKKIVVSLLLDFKLYIYKSHLLIMPFKCLEIKFSGNYLAFPFQTLYES